MASPLKTITLPFNFTRIQKPPLRPDLAKQAFLELHPRADTADWISVISCLGETGPEMRASAPLPSRKLK